MIIKIRGLLIFFYSLLFFLAFIKFEYLNPFNTNWLYFSPDSATFQIGWSFYKNDILRFPIGLNPNYGQSFGSSIIYSDSIPLFALVFKFIGSQLDKSFQYVSAWFLLCIYLQFFFSFKILFYFTKNYLFSFIGANFYLITPIFLFKLTYHFALGAHWLILWCLFILLKYKFNYPIKKILLLTITAISIHFYLAILILIPFFFFFFFKFFFKYHNNKIIFRDFFLIIISLIICMYILGYFEIRVVDALGVGFGKYKLNLLSIIDPVVESRNENWSSIFKSLDISDPEKLEGFNYFGVGQLLLSLFLLSQIFNIFKKKKNEIFEKNLIIFLITVLLFITILSLSNRISFGKYLIFEIELNEFLLAPLSILRSSGRLFWFVNYTVLTLAIILLFFKFQKKKIFIIFFILLIQIIDIYPGLKNNFKKEFVSNSSSKNNIYSDIFYNFKNIMTTFPIAYNPKFFEISSNFENFNTHSTNIVLMSRVDREKISLERYNINNKLIEKNFSDNEIFLIDNLNHLKNLKLIYSTKEHVFLKRNNNWFLAKKNKINMSNKELIEFNNIEIDKVILNKKIVPDLAGKYVGVGWAQNSNNFGSVNEGIYSDGDQSMLIIKNEKKNLTINIELKPNILVKNYSFEMDVYLNDMFYKKIKFNKNEDYTLELKINETNSNNQENMIIKFNFNNVKSPWEQRFHPDSRKLGILIKNISFKLM